MNPLALRLTNVRTFADLDLTFQPGVTAIVGANGAGKSTLIDALDLALFAERGELARKLTRGEDVLEIELTFEHAGETFRVRRQLRRGKSPTLDLERGTGRLEGWNVDEGGPEYGYTGPPTDWESLTRESTDATQALICQTLGLSRATFRASAFVGQNDGAAFTEAKPAERKAMLAEILALDRWADALDRVRADRRGFEVKVAGLHARAEVAQAIVDTRPSIEKAREESELEASIGITALAIADADLAEARDALVAQAANEERARAAQEAHQAARRAVLTLEDEWVVTLRAAEQAGTAREELRRVTALAERVPDLKARIRRFQAATARDDMRKEAARKLAAAENVLAHVGEATCERCGQTLGVEAAEEAARTYKAEAEAALTEAAKYADEAGDVFEPLSWDELLSGEKEARAAAERRAALVEIVRQHEEKAATLNKVADALNAAQEQETAAAVRLATARDALADMDALRASVSAATDAVARHRAALDDARARVVRAEAELERCQKAEQELAETAAKIGHVSLRLDVLAVLERAFGPNGIPAWLIERYAVPQIEAEANRILADFNTPYRVELRTQRQKKDGGLAEALDIIVSDGMHEGDYSEFSGGEKTRLNLALRIALAGLLANRRGAESRVLCIDEPDGLDSVGMEQLAAILGDLVARGVFATVLVVSHQPQLASSFDQVLTIEKHGDRSRVVGALEAVTA